MIDFSVRFLKTFLVFVIVVPPYFIYGQILELFEDDIDDQDNELEFAETSLVQASNNDFFEQMAEFEHESKESFDLSSLFTKFNEFEKEFHAFEDIYHNINHHLCAKDADCVGHVDGEKCDQSSKHCVERKCVGYGFLTGCGYYGKRRLCKNKKCVMCDRDKYGAAAGCIGPNGACKNDIKCVECTKDSDCYKQHRLHGTRACDIMTNKCVACMNDQHCNGNYNGQTCKVDAFKSKANKCVQCVKNANCPNGQLCNNEQCKCQNDGGCHDVDKEKCDLSDGKCKMCLKNSDCLGMCDSKFGVCVACMANISELDGRNAGCDDAAKPFCDVSSNPQNQQKCEACAKNEHCGSSMIDRCCIHPFDGNQCYQMVCDQFGDNCQIPAKLLNPKKCADYGFL